MSNAPICNITPPAPPSVTPVTGLPAIPVATDLGSLIAAVNAIRQVLNQMNHVIPTVIEGFSNTTKPQKKNPKPQTANFQEVTTKRVTKTVKVSNPQDPTQYVMVKQITGLTFQNSQTKETITWSQ